jgi:anaerobic magnesium-protoporphyrin IX monomethyl ester cyclase
VRLFYRFSFYPYITAILHGVGLRKAKPRPTGAEKLEQHTIMAKVTFISLYDRNAYGIRLMSANLKQHGHHCDVIFLKQYNTVRTYKVEVDVGEYPWLGINKHGRVFKYASNSFISPQELDLVRQTLDKLQPDLIGMTVNTPLRIQAIKVTQFVKKHFDVPVIWGGYDPTVNFTDCTEHCDYACVGEGDQTILDVASLIDQGRDFKDVGNLVFVQNGSMVVNPKHPLEPNIDKYPWRDNSPENKYFIENNTLMENHAVINDKPKGVYQAMSARGCPYKCSYCCEATFKSLYSGEKFLRRRSPQDVVAELAEAKRCFDFTSIQFEDEIFAMNVKWLEEFVPLYKQKVNLPFTAYIYPVKDVHNILKLLKDAGLYNCCLALESGSERINKAVFDRVYNRELFIKTASICKELYLAFYTDVITYNPYEDEEDLRKTLEVLIEIGGGFGMAVNKLFVLPGTKMSKLMMQDGTIIKNVKNGDALFNYYCRVFWITTFTHHSRRIINLIEKVKIFRRYPKLLNPALIEILLSPVSSSMSLARALLLKPVKKAVKSFFPRATLGVSRGKG